jgi:tetratricopeptide (TPR) repeat protein
MDRPEKAAAHFSKALELKPDYAEGIVEYANFLLRQKKYQASLDLIEKVSGSEKRRFDYFLVRGQAESGLGRYAAAINSLQEGNKIYNSDTRLLNSLGLCYAKTGQKKEALEVLNASLRLNPDQPEIQALKAEIEKNN